MELLQPPLGEEEERSQDTPKAMPTELQRLLEVGRELFVSGEEAHALRMFKKAFLLSGRPSESGICLFNLGAAYVAAGKPGKALRCLRKARSTGAVKEADADFCFNVAAAYERMGKFWKAEAFYRKAVEGCDGHDPRNVAEAQVKRGYCLASVGETALAAACFRSAGQAYREAKLTGETGMACREAARYALRSASFPPKEVLALLEEGLRACARVADPRLQGKLYNDVGLHFAELGRFAEAEGCFRAALRLCEEGASVQSRAVLLQNLGAVCNARGHFTRSLGFHSQAASLYASLGERHRRAHAQSLYNLAWAHGQAKDPRMAEFYCLQAQKAFAEAGDRFGEGRAREWLASLRLRHPDPAAPSHREAPGLFAESKETAEAPQERIRAKPATLSK